MIDPAWVTSIGVGMGSLMAGAGIFRVCVSSAHVVERIPDALEGQIEIQKTIATATERSADAAECQAKLIPVLEKLETRREEIENSIGVLARNYELIADRLRESNGR